MFRVLFKAASVVYVCECEELCADDFSAVLMMFSSVLGFFLSWVSWKLVVQLPYHTVIA